MLLIQQTESLRMYIVVRLQANGKLSSTFAAAKTQVKKVAKHIPVFEGTSVTIDRRSKLI